MRLWWDVGKTHVHTFCQQCARGSTKRRKSRLDDLEKEVLDLEARLSQPDADPALRSEYREKKGALRDLQLVRSRGAYVRSRLQFRVDLDRGSPFFYSLEKGRANRQQLLTLLADDGSPVSDPEGIRAIARDFYSDLFSPDPSSEDARRLLWEDLPQVSPEGVGRLDANITLAELTGALDGLSRGNAPGLDGLTVEFFRAFWDVLGGDYAGVLGESVATGEMPLSWRRAIIALLPKKGDLRCLKNWRPVSLLSTDYKIFARALASRLGSMLDHMIHPDQSYTVPGRCIHDNLHLVRDLIHLSQRTGLSGAFLSLDQEKAFDRVEHEYLLGTLRAFGFGTHFVARIRLLYSAAECLIKVNGSLTAPLRFGTGVR